MAKKKVAPSVESSLKLGAYVQQLRAGRGLTVRGLAARAGLDASWVSRLENGHIASPDARYLWRISRCLGVEVADIYLEAGYGDAHGLPGFGPYLRAKYHLSDKAIAQLEAHFELYQQQHQQETRDAP
jgi:transcriptional regulator with XRE-family HTH domain